MAKTKKLRWTIKALNFFGWRRPYCHFDRFRPNVFLRDAGLGAGVFQYTLHLLFLKERSLWEIGTGAAKENWIDHAASEEIRIYSKELAEGDAPQPCKE